MRIRIRYELFIAARFGTVGIIATAVHIMIVWLLLSLTELHPLVANAFAFMTAFVISFVGNYRWTFGSPGKPAKAMTRFFLISASAFSINTLLLAFLVRAGWFSPTISATFSAAVVPVITFLASRFWGFNLPSSTLCAPKEELPGCASLYLNFNRHFLYGFLVGGLALIQALPFLSGYRLTADDVAFHQFAMDGWSASWDFVKGTAIIQGRIVHFIDLPFSLLGSYYADDWYFRVFYTTLYFVNFLLIATYVSMLLGVRVTLLILLALISFHPLDYFHLAPTAYPFHVSLPVLLIVFSRIGLWRLRLEKVRNFKVIEVAFLVLCFLGMMFSEYGFLFGLSLMFAELLTRTLQSVDGDNKFLRSISHWLRHPYTLKDTFLVLLFMALYLGFRFVFPSAYDGNKVASDLRVDLIIKTLFGHVYGGTSIASFDRHACSIISYLNKLVAMNWFLVLLVFCGTFAVAIHLLRGLEHANRSSWLAHRFVSMALIGILCACIVTLPVAMTGKYQSWCGSINSCLFLDSRISYFGVAVFLAGMVSLAVVCFGATRWSLNITTVIFSTVLACAASATYINNIYIESDMKRYVSAWDRARYLACLPENSLENFDLWSIVEPVRRVSYHPGFDVNHYWSSYIKNQRPKVHCEEQLYRIADLYPRLSLGERMLANSSGAALVYMGRGWSSSEGWGTWSEGRSAEIVLPIYDIPKLILFEANTLINSSHTEQRLKISINGIPAASIAFTEPSVVFEVKIPESVKQKSESEFLKIGFEFPDAARPKDIGLGNDSRELALGLVAITVR